MQTRFNALTGIRAVAASMVFLYHNRKYWYNLLPDFVMRNLNEYHTGVTLFFVLSGFLIAYTYKDSPTKNLSSYIQYIGIRIARIFPVYWLLLTVRYFHIGYPPNQNIWWNFSLLKGLSDVHNLDGIPQSWTLTVEFCFYTIAPFIFLFTKKSICKTWLGLFVMYAIAVAAGYIWYSINGNHNRWLYNWRFVADGTFFGRFNEFFIGVLMAYYLQKQPRWLLLFNKKNITAVAALLCIITIYCLSRWEKNMYSVGTENIAGLLIRNLILPLFIVAFLYGLITEETRLSKILGSKLMVLLGNASYIFYLLHLGYANFVIVNKVLLPDRNFILLWLISIAGYLLFEKPVYSFLKKRIHQHINFQK